MKILAVDDSVPILEILQLLLKGPEFELITTTESLKAIEIIKEENIDVVVTDIRMPFLNGIELAYEIRKLYSQVPIVFYSSEINGKEIYKNDVENLGYAIYVEHKSISKLLDALRTLLRTGRT